MLLLYNSSKSIPLMITIRALPIKYAIVLTRYLHPNQTTEMRWRIFAIIPFLARLFRYRTTFEVSIALWTIPRVVLAKDYAVRVRYVHTKLYYSSSSLGCLRLLSINRFHSPSLMIATVNTVIISTDKTIRAAITLQPPYYKDPYQGS